MLRILLPLLLILGACTYPITRAVMQHPQSVGSKWESRHLYAVSGDNVVRAHFEVRDGGHLRFILEMEHEDPLWAHVGAWRARVYVDGRAYNPRGAKELFRYRVDHRWRGHGVILFRARNIVGEHNRRIVLELKRRDKTYRFVWNFHPGT